MTEVEKNIERMGLKLPDCPIPVAAYQPAQIAGKLIFVSGNTAFEDGKLQYYGKVGTDVTQEDAYESAKICVLRCISGLRSIVNLDSVSIVYLSGYVNAAPDFKNHPAVVNGASELIEAVFGKDGKHARKAIGVSSLPDNASVEVELVAVMKV